MTGSEIMNILVPIGIFQLIVDLLSNYFVYNGDRYQRALRNLERCRAKLDRAQLEVQTKGNSNKNIAKKFDRSKAEYSTAAADVARRHFPPNILSSLLYFLLLRILGTEYKGKVLGVLPFVPYDFVTRVTSRGLDWRELSATTMEEDIGTKMHPKQAFSFFIVYLLAGFTVKYYINKAVGTKPPKGADQGYQTIVDSPMGQAMARSLGIDPNDLKVD